MISMLELARQSLRRAARHPLYSSFAVLTLALSIGGGTLIFSIYDTIAFRTLPVDKPEELVSVRQVNIDEQGRSADFGRFSLEDFEEMRTAAEPIAEISAFAAGEAVLRAGRHTERAEVQWVDPRYFEILGVRILSGRGFVENDDPRNGGEGGVVITAETWKRLFDDDPDTASSTIVLDGVARPILGVTTAGFRGFEVGANPALFAIASEAPSNWAFFRLFGRLAPGVSPSQLEARLAAAHEALRSRDPNRQSFMIVDGKSSQATERIEVVDGSTGESQLRGTATLPLVLVGGLLALVLAVLAANLANLLAVRALSERGASAIRLALGAPRAALAAGWFIESLILTLSGAVVGLLGVASAGETLLRWAPLPPWTNGLAPTIDVRTTAVAFAMALFVALVVGSLAAWESSQVDPQTRLTEEGARTTHSKGRVRWRNTLIAAQVALSVVLLVAMGLFARSASALLSIDTGFPLNRVAMFRIDIPDTLAQESGDRFARLRTALARMPGVSEAGFSANAVLGGVAGYVMGAIEGYVPGEGEILMFNTLGVSPGFLDALEMPVTSGRLFDEQDLQREAGSVVINREFVDKYFDGVDPIGRRISFNFQKSDWSEPDENDLAIVGVVDDRMISHVREAPTPRIYPLSGDGSTSLTYYVRSTGDPMQLAPGISRAVRDLIPEAAMGPIQTLAEQRDQSIRRELLTRDLTLVFGGLAAALAALGLFAVLSYLVGERRREFGVRQALGARPGDLSRRVLLDGLRPVTLGLAAGLGIAALLTKLASSQLYEITARDPVSFAAAILLMGIIALAACVPPAIRASRTDPAKALRAD